MNFVIIGDVDIFFFLYLCARRSELALSFQPSALSFFSGQEPQILTAASQESCDLLYLTRLRRATPGDCAAFSSAPRADASGESLRGSRSSAAPAPGSRRT